MESVGKTMIDDSKIHSECTWMSGQTPLRVRVLARDHSAPPKWGGPGVNTFPGVDVNQIKYLIEVLDPSYRGMRKAIALAQNLYPLGQEPNATH